MTKLYRVHRKEILHFEGFVHADSAAEAIRIEEDEGGIMGHENVPFTATKVKAEEVLGIPSRLPPRPYYDEYIPLG